MSLSIRKRLLWVFVALVALLGETRARGASDELVKAATKEGNLMIYGTTQIDHMQA